MRSNSFNIDTCIEKCFKKERLTEQVRFLFQFCIRKTFDITWCSSQEVKVLCERAKSILTKEENIRKVRGIIIVMHILRTETKKTFRNLKPTFAPQVVTPVTVVGDVHGQVFCRLAATNTILSRSFKKISLCSSMTFWNCLKSEGGLLPTIICSLETT